MISYPHVKINLGLNVLRKREDGYHDIETLFVPYPGIHDTLEIISGDDFSRTSASLFARYGTPSCKGGHVPEIVQAVSDDGKVMITIARKGGVDWDPLGDLCVKAYRRLGEEFGLPAVKIFLEKQSPVGAGLGGGSSDAAFTVRMLDEMFSLGLGKEKMALVAAEIGSDCAFFVNDAPMFGEGRGERLTDWDPESIGIRGGEEDVSLICRGRAFDLKVIVPDGISVSTAEAYGGIIPGIPEISLKEVLSYPVEKWREFLVNDFEHTVFERHPELKSIKDSLYMSGAVYASMSGSGSALFALYDCDPGNGVKD